MKKLIRLTESNLIKLIQKIVSEQVREKESDSTILGDRAEEYYKMYPEHRYEPFEHKYSQAKPLIIPNDPYVYTYNFVGTDWAGNVYKLYTKLKTENKYKWREVNPVDNQKEYCTIYYKYGHILEMLEKVETSYCSNINRNNIPKYMGPHN